jgi:hypothetical protein
MEIDLVARFEGARSIFVLLAIVPLSKVERFKESGLLKGGIVKAQCCKPGVICW